MSGKRTHSDTIVSYNISPRMYLEEVDMGVKVPDDEEKVRDLKRPRLNTYYGDEAELDDLEKNLCLSCIIL